MFDRPKTKAMRQFLAREKDRVVGLSIEDDGVFIYTNSSEWCDDYGAGTFRADSETAAIKDFYANVQRAPITTELEPTTVYVVVWSDYDTYEIDSIWSDREVADRRCEKVNVAHKKRFQTAPWTVDELTVNPKDEDLPRTS